MKKNKLIICLTSLVLLTIFAGATVSTSSKSQELNVNEKPSEQNAAVEIWVISGRIAGIPIPVSDATVKLIGNTTYTLKYDEKTYKYFAFVDGDTYYTVNITKAGFHLINGTDPIIFVPGNVETLFGPYLLKKNRSDTSFCII